MTALPLRRPRLLTAAEFAALDEAPEGRYELEEGKIVMSLAPAFGHQTCQHKIQVQLEAQVPAHLEIAPGVDVDLELVPPSQPGFVRIPDIVVVTRAGSERLRSGGGILRASEVVLAIEIISPGSRRTDNLIKRSEYADAGIPHYWIVDIDGRPSLTACHNAGEFGYVDPGPATGTFTTTEPFPVRIELDKLG
jgi:Uma2 family endonuclease